MSYINGPVIIVGGGPVGLTLAWLLQGSGVPVQLFEAEPEISDQLRASTFHPPTLDMLAPSGITAQLHEAGQITPTWQIRMHSTSQRAEFDLAVLKEDTDYPWRLQCRQAVLSRALYERLPEGICHFSHPVSRVEEDADGVSVTAGDKVVRGALVVGCDGARSIVREAMGVGFEGKTYPETTLLVTTHFPFEDHLDGLSGVNYIWKDEGTFSLLRLPDVWRISLHPKAGQSVEDAMEDAAIREAVVEIIGPQAFADGQQLEIIEKRIYRIHRRVATHYVQGRLLLAGDAAHLNSPKGGMGMNGGIHDAFCLADKITALANGGAPALLTQYQRQRQPIARDDIGGQADQNRSRMMNKSAAQKQAHLKELQAIASDSGRARDFLLRSSMIEGLRRAQALA